MKTKVSLLKGNGFNILRPWSIPPRATTETETTPAFALGFLLLWALSFAQIEYRAHYRQVGDVLLNGRNLERPVTGRLIHKCRFKRQFNTVPIKKSGRPL